MMRIKDDFKSKSPKGTEMGIKEKRTIFNSINQPIDFVLSSPPLLPQDR
jgi:hypothetical protein